MTICGTAHAADWQYPQAVASVPPTGIDISPRRTAIAVTVSAPAPYFTVSADDIGKAVSAQIRGAGRIRQGRQSHAAAPARRARFTPPTTRLPSASRALQVDSAAHRWQGQAYILSNGKTETVKPIAGFYQTQIDVPVLTRQLGASDVIAASDIEMKPMSERQLRKDTITDAAQLIGKSPHRMVSAERPIRAEEIAMPLLIKKGQTVEMTYTTAYVHIRDQAEALEDGAAGETIRVKNSKSGKAVSSRVVDAGHVEANIGEM